LKRKKSEGNGTGTLFYACQHVSEKKDDAWFLYSRYSNHITPEKEIFLHMALPSVP
jgi:hypothetical protein